MRLLVTGGMGFIGSNFIRHMLTSHEQITITNLDRLSCGSNLLNLKDIPEEKAYRLVKGDINDFDLVKRLSKDIEGIINIAAETHVDRSILNPKSFLDANTVGVVGLLEVCRLHDLIFLQVSTDEVYGPALNEKPFAEEDRLGPSSPYAASKGAADLFVNAYHKTYGLRTYITRSTNNFGPYQFPEKLMPKAIIRATLGLRVPLYGSGRQVRDWIYVGDHCDGLDLILRKGRPGQTYNIAGGNLFENMQIVQAILQILGKQKSLVDHVEDRPGHDVAYKVSTNKITRELGWKPKSKFEDALRQTVLWYQMNESWWRPVINDKVLSPTPWKEAS